MISFFESLLPAEFIRAFALTLFHSLWQGALLAILVAILILALRKYKPAVRYAVLYLMLVLTPVMFVATFLMIFEPDPLQTNSKTIYLSNHFQDIENQAGAGLTFVESDTAKALYLSIVRFFENNARLFVLIWMTGFFLFLIRFSGSIFYVYRLKNYHIRQVDEPWNNTLRRLSEKLGLKKTVRLAESGLAKVPMTIGYLKPVILLPIGTLSGVPPQQIDAILLHELAHILRKDYLLNLIQSVIELLFFYHPLTWWLSGLIRQEREHICDDIAVEINQDHINYIKALTTMEELNSKSPLLASAMTGSRKKLLMRVKRLLTPVKIRKGSAEGIIGFLLLISLVFALSFNALSTIPDSYDLTGRESGERTINMLPYNPNPVIKSEILTAEPGTPDSIVSTSRSGKVIVKVYTDTIDSDDEENVQVFVETLEDQFGDWEQDRNSDRKEYTKEVIIYREDADQTDSLSKIVIIRSGDSVKVIKNDTILVFPDDYDTSFTTEYGFQFYGFDAPEIHEFPELQEMPEMRYYYFDDDQARQAEKFERQLRDQESQMREFEWQQKELQMELGNDMIIIQDPDTPPHNWEWEQRVPEPQIKQSEKIIRQELRDDGLT
ncbi:MAG: M56 family metallopeptidase, partial [Bacteroidales bacterium]|nr:M56 family metallopeptidase [Bacteroidales bacterium]